MMTNAARRFLIKVGKVMPFLVCLLLSVHYAEVLVSVLTCDYVSYGDCLVINTPLSFYLASLVQYNMLVVVIMFIISVAIDACKWNLLTIAYLAFNLVEKRFFVFEMTTSIIIVISTLNLLISVFLLRKGYSIFLKTVN